MGKSTPTPTPSICSSSQPSLSRAKVKGSLYTCALGAEIPPQENFYATTEIVKASFYPFLKYKKCSLLKERKNVLINKDLLHLAVQAVKK